MCHPVSNAHFQLIFLAEDRMRDGLHLSVRSLSQKEYALAIEWMEVAYE